MSKQLIGIKENLHYHENRVEGNLNANLPRLADGVLGGQLYFSHALYTKIASTDFARLATT
jgi:hypothetical protein